MIPHQLALALKRYEQLYNELKPPLSLWQLIVMREMVGEASSREAQLAEKTGLNQAIVTNVLHTLRRKKYIVNKGGGNPKRVAVTELGIEARALCLTLVRRVDEQFFPDVHTRGNLMASLAAVTTWTASLSQTPSPRV